VFDFGFGKLFILGVVALIVIGPERLPRVARTLGHLYGRLQRYVTNVKADIHREMEAAELGAVKSEFESAARSFQEDIESKAREVEREVRDAQVGIECSLDIHAAPANEPAPPPAPGASPQLELGIEEPAPGAPRDRAAG
jgi:sec-independent protein translocase protein TatB